MIVLRNKARDDHLVLERLIDAKFLLANRCLQLVE
jgi:hypothetical protein